MAAPTKKRGAPASASKVVRRRSRKDTEEHRIKSEIWRAGVRKVANEIQASKPSVPAKLIKSMGKSNPDVLVRRTGKIGRPPIAYTDELDAQLFELIVSGLSLEKISRLPNMPSPPVLLTWIGTKDHPFSSTYARAKALLVPLYEEKAMQYATEPQYGEITVERDGEHGYREVRTVDMVEHRKLAFAAHQWALGWMTPKKHGRNPDLNDGKPNAQLEGLFRSLKEGPID